MSSVTSPSIGEGGRAGFTDQKWCVIQSGLQGDSWLVCEDVPGRLRPICAVEHGHPDAEALATFIAAVPALYEALWELWSESGNAIRGMALAEAALALAHPGTEEE